MAGLAARHARQRDEPLLVSHKRIRAEQYPFDPTENRGIRADTQRQTKDRQDRKSRTPPQHPQTEAYILTEVLAHGHTSLVAIDFLGWLDPPDIAKRRHHRL